jgi:hypothetical protein
VAVQIDLCLLITPRGIKVKVLEIDREGLPIRVVRVREVHLDIQRQ